MEKNFEHVCRCSMATLSDLPRCEVCGQFMQPQQELFTLEPEPQQMTFRDVVEDVYIP